MTDNNPNINAEDLEWNAWEHGRDLTNDQRLLYTRIGITLIPVETSYSLESDSEDE